MQSNEEELKFTLGISVGLWAAGFISLLGGTLPAAICWVLGVITWVYAQVNHSKRDKADALYEAHMREVDDK